jgi:hypothetical protein
MVAVVALFVPAAASASATPAIEQWWGNVGNAKEVLGGTFNKRVRGIARNDTTEDIYVTDSAESNNRVERFSGSGQFLSLWGRDVVNSGAGNNDAIQSLTVSATAGAFKLTFKSETTGELAFNASTAQVEAALNALLVVNAGGGSVKVTGGPGDAAGSVPYGVQFNGGPLAGQAEPAMTVANGTTPLSGGTGAAVATLNPGGVTGFEICPAANAANCKAAAASTGAAGDLSEPEGIAVDQSTATGNVYVLDAANRRVEEFTAAGIFIRAFGQDVVNTGPDNSPAANAVQSLTVTATGGKYTLSFQGQTTGELPFSSPAAQVMAALEGLSSIRSGDVEVTGAASPFTITFKGALANSPQPLIVAASAAGEPLTGGTAVVANTTTGATGFEICVAARGDVCKAGTAAGTAGALGAFGTVEGNSTLQQGLTMAPPGAPNAGDVLVTDSANARVSEFTATGEFKRAFGWDTVSVGPSDSAVNERQSVTVSAAAGKFALSFAGKTTGATATATYTNPTSTIPLTSVTGGAFAPGEVITSNGTGFKAGTTVASCTPSCAAPTSITLSQSTEGTGTQSSKTLTAYNLPFNASAAEVEAALNGLSSIGGVGGSVSVSGGPGDATGTSPYLVTFGGTLSGDNVAQMTSSAAGLSGGLPSTAATTATVAEGGAFEVCKASTFDVCKGGAQGSGVGQFGSEGPNRIAEDSSGRIYTVEAPGNLRVQRFTLPGNVVTAQGEFAAAALHGTNNNAGVNRDDTVAVAVDDSGRVYAAKYVPRGAGTPPVPPTGGFGQVRIFRLDPTSGLVEDTMAANPGTEGVVQFDNITGLAVSPAGTSLFALTTQAGGGAGGDRSRVWRFGTFAPPAPVEVGATEVGAATAKLTAKLMPSAIPLGSFYRFEYSPDGITWTKVPATDEGVGNGSAGGESSSCPSPQAAICRVSQSISGLVPNTAYQVRLVAYSLFNAGAATPVAGAPFTTKAEPPLVHTGLGVWSGPPASEPSLRLGGTINPGNERTTYRFQYVDDATYQADTKRAEEEGKTGAALAEAAFEHAAAVPAASAEAGRGLATIAVHQSLFGLDPARAYDFRLVATNSEGTTRGGANHVDSPLPNQRFYELVSAGEAWGMGVQKGPAAVMGDGERAAFFANTFGQPRAVPGVGGVYLSERSAHGWTVADTAPDPTRAKNVVSNLYTEVQNISGDLGAQLWVESSVAEHERSEAQLAVARIDGGLALISPQLMPLAGGGGGEIYEVQGSSPDFSTVTFRYGIGGAGVTLLPGETLVAPKFSNLYAVTDAGGSSQALEIVNRANGREGAVLGGVCGARLGGLGAASGAPVFNSQGGVASNAISTSGSVIYFTAYPNAPASGACQDATAGFRRVFKRVAGSETVEVSKSQCSRVSPPAPTPCKTEAELNGDDQYFGASEDGSVVFFTSVRQLTSSDEDTTSDLYEYDASPPPGKPKLVQVSAGETVGAHTAGSGAKVLGVVDNSGDGSRVYFVAEGVLTGENPVLHRTPVEGQRNLYAYQRDAGHPSGRLVFVGALVAADQTGNQENYSNWLKEGIQGNKTAMALPAGSEGSDGRALLIATKAQLLPSVDTDPAIDLYLYRDDASETAKALRCLTCVAGGISPAVVAERVGALRLSDAGQESRAMSADLTKAVFTSSDKLLAGDENNVADAYLWEEAGSGECTAATAGPDHSYVANVDGCLTLVSVGAEGFGSLQQVNANNTEVWLAEISASGRDVFFSTEAPLVGADANGVPDLYDARVGGGFAEQQRPEGCEGQEGCQGPPQALPPATAAGSTIIGASGNLTPPAPCPRGKVRKKGRCVKKRMPGHGHRKHRARHNRGGNR